MLVPTNVTEVAAKLGGARGWQRGGRGRPRGWALVGRWRRGGARPSLVCPAAAPLAAGPQFSWLMASRGTVATTAMAAATPAAATAALVTFRRRARLLISSNVPGGGGKGRTCALIHWSSSSRGSVIEFPQRRLQPGPGMEQVGLDGALRAAEQRGHIPDREARIVVQQERAAQPVRQGLQQRPYVHIL